MNPNRRRGSVRSDDNRKACCHDNRFAGAGLVQRHGSSDRDDQPSSAGDEPERGNISGELAVLDDECDCPGNGGLLRPGEIATQPSALRGAANFRNS